MGAWSDSILADDDAQEVYDHYRRLINQGKEHAAVRQALERSWADSITDSDDGPIFWFAIAQAQWEFGQLDADVMRRVAEIADKGLGLERWREGGPSMLSKREKVVRDFLNKISKPNPNPVKRRGEKRYPPIYLPGECLAVELNDGAFGAVIVLACDDSHDIEGFDIVALLEWHSAEKPPLNFFEKVLLIRPNEDGRLIPVVRRCYARSHKKMRSQLHQVGQISRSKTDATNKATRFMGRWEEVVSDLERYYGLRS
jgi:hypothetical protein